MVISRRLSGIDMCRREHEETFFQQLAELELVVLSLWRL